MEAVGDDRQLMAGTTNDERQLWSILKTDDGSGRRTRRPGRQGATLS